MVEIPTKVSLDILEVFTDYTLPPIHITTLAKRLNKSHVTLLPHINQLCTEHILESKMQGKNRLLTIQNNTFTEYYLQMAEIHKTIRVLKDNPLLKHIAADIQEINAPVIIFGSYAKQTETQNSDIDIAILQKKNQRTIRLCKEISAKYNKQISVQCIPKLQHSTLSREILKAHIILTHVGAFLHEKDTLVQNTI